jgi:hypothetical protein
MLLALAATLAIASLVSALQAARLARNLQSHPTHRVLLVQAPYWHGGCMYTPPLEMVDIGPGTCLFRPVGA